MNVVVYPHLKQADWLKQRRKNWKAVFAYMFLEEPKYTWKHIEKYYFDGDVDSFIKGSLAVLKKQKISSDRMQPYIYEAIKYSPAQSREQLMSVIEKMLSWYDNNKQQLEPRYYDTAMYNFIEILYDFADTPEVGFNVDLADDMFFWLYGNTYDPERVFPIPLGSDKWQPKLIGYDRIIFLLMRRFNRYLFYKKLKPYNLELASKVVEERYMTYLLSLLKHVDEDFFVEKVVDRRYVNERGISIGSQQFVVRSFFIRLLGYKEIGDKEFYCRDEELYETLKREVFAVKMPEKFDKFVEFVHEKKEESHEYGLWD